MRIGPAKWAAFAALVVGACRSAPVSREAPPAPSAESARPVASVRPASRPEPTRSFNVVLILVDSLRADALRVAPKLTALEKRAVSYTRAYSISSVTARSVAPLLVGKYPSEMVRTGTFFTQWYPQNLFLGERLEAAGHRALAVTAHAYFNAPSMHQGFADFRVLPGTTYDDPEPEPTSERMTKLAERWLARRADSSGAQRFFAYVHYMDPHQPYLEHTGWPDYGDDPRHRYDGEVHYTDHWVGELIEWIDRQPWGAETAVIVSADHGEAFGEHGQIKHGYEVWDTVVHVPLMFVVPGTRQRRIDTPRGHIDLAPTILDLMGVPIVPPLRGKSLVSELRGGEVESRPVVVDLPRDNLQDRRRAVIDGRFKLIARGDDERWLLYDLIADPRERQNLTERKPGEFRRMKKLYFEISEQIPNEEVHGPAVLANAPPGRRW